MKTIDRLNKTENGKVKFARMDLGRTWKMKQERLSNRYTSRIDEIIRVKCNNQLRIILEGQESLETSSDFGSFELATNAGPKELA